MDYHSEVDKLCAMFQFIRQRRVQEVSSAIYRTELKHGCQSTHCVEIVCQFPLFCSVWDQFWGVIFRCAEFQLKCDMFYQNSWFYLASLFHRVKKKNKKKTYFVFLWWFTKVLFANILVFLTLIRLVSVILQFVGQWYSITLLISRHV